MLGVSPGLAGFGPIRGGPGISAGTDGQTDVGIPLPLAHGSALARGSPSTAQISLGAGGGAAQGARSPGRRAAPRPWGVLGGRGTSEPQPAGISAGKGLFAAPTEVLGPVPIPPPVLPAPRSPPVPIPAAPDPPRPVPARLGVASPARGRAGTRLFVIFTEQILIKRNT